VFKRRISPLKWYYSRFILYPIKSQSLLHVNVILNLFDLSSHTQACGLYVSSESSLYPAHNRVHYIFFVMIYFSIASRMNIYFIGKNLFTLYIFFDRWLTNGSLSIHSKFFIPLYIDTMNIIPKHIWTSWFEFSLLSYIK
jgi:hypothetical protein